MNVIQRTGRQASNIDHGALAFLSSLGTLGAGRCHYGPGPAAVNSTLSRPILVKTVPVYGPDRSTQKRPRLRYARGRLEGRDSGEVAIVPHTAQGQFHCQENAC